MTEHAVDEPVVTRIFFIFMMRLGFPRIAGSNHGIDLVLGEVRVNGQRNFALREAQRLI